MRIVECLWDNIKDIAMLIAAKMPCMLPFWNFVQIYFIIQLLINGSWNSSENNMNTISLNRAGFSMKFDNPETEKKLEKETERK